MGHVTEPPDSRRNFLVVDQKTEKSEIEEAFQSFTRDRKDIGILLINQHVRESHTSGHEQRVLTSHYQIAEQIRDSVDRFQDAFPAVLEIPSKDHPYDPEKDSVLRRVRRLFGE